MSIHFEKEFEVNTETYLTKETQDHLIKRNIDKENHADYEILDVEQDLKHYKVGLYKVVIVSVIFMFLFSAFNTAQNMVSQIYGQLGYDKLGNIALLVLYAVFGVSNIFATNITERFKYKYVLFWSSLGYTSFVAAGLIPALCEDESRKQNFYCTDFMIYFVIIFAAVLCGLGASLIWLAQGGYVDGVSSLCPSKRGTYFGLFWAIFQASQVAGNGLAAVLLNLGHTTYFLVNTILGIAAGFCFLLIPDVAQDIQPPETRKSPKEKLKEITDLFKVRELYELIPFMCFTGCGVAFYAGFLHSLVERSLGEGIEESEVNTKTTYVFLCLGVSEIISGIISGKLADKFNTYSLATLGTLYAEIALILSILGYYTKSYFVCFLCAAAWGFSDCFFNSHCSVLCSQDYKGKLGIFSIFRMFLSVSTAITLITNILLGTELMHIFILIIFVIQILTTFSTSLLKKPKFD